MIIVLRNALVSGTTHNFERHNHTIDTPPGLNQLKRRI
jgi:hypothetical protein